MFGIVHDRGLRDVLDVVHDTEKTPPLHFLLAWASARIGDPTLWIRLPSLLAGVALVPLAYVLGRDTVGRRPGLVAAAIVALQPYAIFYATEARSYSLVALFAGRLDRLPAARAGHEPPRLVGGLRARRPRRRVHALRRHLRAGGAGRLGVLGPPRAGPRAARRARADRRSAYVPWIPSYLVQQGHSADEARRIELLAPQSLEHLVRVHGQLLLGQPFVGFRDGPRPRRARARDRRAGDRARRGRGAGVARSAPERARRAGDPAGRRDAARDLRAERAAGAELPAPAQPDRVAAGDRRASPAGCSSSLGRRAAIAAVVLLRARAVSRHGGGARARQPPLAVPRRRAAGSTSGHAPATR